MSVSYFIFLLLACPLAALAIRYLHLLLRHRQGRHCFGSTIVARIGGVPWLTARKYRERQIRERQDRDSDTVVAYEVRWIVYQLFNRVPVFVRIGQLRLYECSSRTIVGVDNVWTPKDLNPHFHGSLHYDDVLWG